MTSRDQNHNDKNEGDNSSPEIVMQKPGEVIAPEVADGVVEKLAKEIYGFEVVRCKQLNGYDDKNYHIRVAATSSNPHVTSLHPEGYVLKVVNTLDTKRPEILYAQIEFMKHLRSRGIATQDPVPTLSGDYVAFYKFPPLSGNGEAKTHAVCLRTFIAGQILYDVTLTRDLCFKLGQFQASMTKALEDFSHPFYDTFDCLWSLNNVPKLKDFVHVITDVRDRRVIDDVIDEFIKTVLPRRSEIRTGFIHGDPNEQNILVQRKSDATKSSPSPSPSPSLSPGDPDEFVISGVLDFQDAARTHPLYDLAMLIAYTSLQAVTFDPLEVGGHVLAGYCSVLEVPASEASLLRVAVAGRLAQSLVLGAYNYSLDPGNEYLLTTAARGWAVLHALWDTPPDTLRRSWDAICTSYQQ